MTATSPGRTGDHQTAEEQAALRRVATLIAGGAAVEEVLAAAAEEVGRANAEAQAALKASRARIVDAADQARRRIERDLHGGAQQRLIYLALLLRQAQAAVPAGAGELAERLEGAVAAATAVLDDLQDIAFALHPAILTESGLHTALHALAHRSAVPVRLDVQVAGRLPEHGSGTAMYVVLPLAPAGQERRTELSTP